MKPFQIVATTVLCFAFVTLVFGQSSSKKTLTFKRTWEPKEKAFSVLVPEGWQVEGGIFRVDPISHGAANAIAAKVDFAVKSDRAGNVMIRWLPDMLYFDVSHSPAGQMGLFPTGSNYNGMTVYPFMSFQQFISNVVFPYAHPQVADAVVVEAKDLPNLEESFYRAAQSIWGGTSFSYDAGLIKATYTENDEKYTEQMVTVIENWGALGAGMWGNKETYFIRAPENEYKKWLPILAVIQSSVQINRQWFAGELRGQLERGGKMNEVMGRIQEIEQAIVKHKQQTNAEIHNDMFLTLTDQEEYVNPFTNEVEVGSNQWDHRWTNEAGDVIYTNDESYDPRVDVNLNRSDYKRSKIRKRFPQ